MAKKKVCISYDHENDKHYRYLLEAWDANDSFEFEFNNKTPAEINSENVSRIKAGLTTKIKEAGYLLVLIGEYATEEHENSDLIGNTNWISWEIAKAKELGKKLVGVKLDNSYDSPSELKNAGAAWAKSFSQDAIIKALESA